MALKTEAGKILPAVEKELRRQVSRLDAPSTRAFHEMIRYHMGWKVTGAHRQTAGKRIRPLICVLSCASAGGRWREALPAAAALEIVHNFSLVHDDIEDNSPTRRGRPALWTKYGTPMAINAGDALLTIADEAILDLQKDFSPDTVVEAARLLQAACLDLTRGQFLDLAHQSARQLSIRSYWPMVEGKTAALLAACTQIGALLGGATTRLSEKYRKFGRLLGLAFQVKDDILGIWGNEAVTGKSTVSDLAEGKLSLPVLYGLSRNGLFATRWRNKDARQEKTGELRQLLTEEGAYTYSVNQGKRLTEQAQLTLRSLRPQGAAGAALIELADQLLARES